MLYSRSGRTAGTLVLVEADAHGPFEGATDTRPQEQGETFRESLYYTVA